MHVKLSPEWIRRYRSLLQRCDLNKPGAAPCVHGLGVSGAYHGQYAVNTTLTGGNCTAFDVYVRDICHRIKKSVHTTINLVDKIICMPYNHGYVINKMPRRQGL
jgi:hypothetical protein